MKHQFRLRFTNSINEPLSPKQTIFAARAPRTRHVNSEAIKQLALKTKIKSPGAKKRRRSAKKGCQSPLAEHTDTIFNKTYSTTNLKIVPKQYSKVATPDEHLDISANIILSGKR